jgi:hypothetical protein
VRRSLSVAALAIVVQGPPAVAAVEQGWADEFFSGFVECTTTINGCNVSNYFAGPFWIQDNINDTTTFPTWAYVGMQGSNATGRANARSKVSSRFYENDPAGGRVMTVTLDRKRVLWPNFPGEGALCPGTVNGTFVGSAQYTINSMSVPANYHFEQRLLPVMNFSAEFTVGQDTGYIETITVNTGGGMGNTASEVGCFKLRWL